MEKKKEYQIKTKYIIKLNEFYDKVVKSKEKDGRTDNQNIK